MSQIDKVLIIPRRLFSDERGWFLKAITGTEENIPNHTGEVYLTMGYPGEKKGGHFHPEALEWFTVVRGKCTYALEDIETKERKTFELSFEDAKTVFIPNNVAHSFTNSGTDEMILVAYTDKLYDPNDTVKYEI